MEHTIWSLTKTQWLDMGISALLLLAVLLLGRVVISFLLDKVLFQITRKTKTTLDNQILQAIKFPLYLLIVVLALNAALARLSFIPEDWNTPVSYTHLRAHET